MKFGKYSDAYQKFHEEGEGWSEFYKRAISKFLEENDSENLAVAEVEYKHRLEKRPYYRVWPIVWNAISKTRLDINGDFVSGGIGLVCSIEIPDGSEIRFDKNLNVTSCVMSVFEPRRAMRGVDIARVSVICCCEDDSKQYTPAHPILSISIRHGETIEDSIRASCTFGGYHNDAFFDLLRMVVMVINLKIHGSKLLSADLMQKHTKWLGTDREEEFHEKAKNRGKFGFNIGKELQESIERGEVSPHFRAPHFATVWTGKGRTVPKFVLRTGEGGGPILVKKESLAKVPTGYYGKEEI